MDRNAVARRFCLILPAILAIGCGKSGTPAPTKAPFVRRTPLELSCWVWNATEPLDAGTQQQVEASGIKKIYWQVTELIWTDGKFRPDLIRKLPPDTATLRYIPVIRISSTLTDPALASAGDLAEWARRSGVRDAVQFDYDCPQRLLRNYAALLAKFREKSGIAWLATTALGDWHGAADWPAVESVVDAVFPMLYDVEKELPPVTSGPPAARPLADARTVRLVEHWSAACRKPWHAGLPNFRRLSLFRQNKLQGHLRSWTMEDIMANPAVSFHSNGEPGVQRILVRQSFQIGDTSLTSGDWLVLRECDPQSLSSAVDAVSRSTAEGLVWYPLPRPNLASSGWSLPMLTQGLTSAPQAALSLKNGVLVLHNTSAADFGPLATGHTLELRFLPAPPRELFPGEFHRREDSTFLFPSLPSGGKLCSGAIVFAPGSTASQIEYRVNAGAWQSVASP